MNESNKRDDDYNRGEEGQTPGKPWGKIVAAVCTAKYSYPENCQSHPLVPHKDSKDAI